MKGRIKDDNSSVPQKDGDWLYWNAFDAGARIPEMVPPASVAGGRDRGRSSTSPNLPSGHDYFRLGGHAVSPDGTAARLCDRHQRLGTLRAEGARSCHRRRSAGHDRELALRPGLGRGFRRASSTPTPTRTGARRRSGITGSAIRKARIAKSIANTTRNSASASAAPSRAALPRSPPATMRPTKSGCCRLSDFSAEPVLVSPRVSRTVSTISMSARAVSTSASTTPM